MEKRSLLALPLTCLAILLPGPCAEARQKQTFRAGAHAQNINPKKYPVSVNGGMTDRQANAARAPLHARCLVLDDGKARLALCVIDACMVPREITDEAKRLIGCVVATEIYDVLKHRAPFDQRRFVAALHRLPTLPWEAQEVLRSPRCDMPKGSRFPWCRARKRREARGGAGECQGGAQG